MKPKTPVWLVVAVAVVLALIAGYVLGFWQGMGPEPVESGVMA